MGSAILFLRSSPSLITSHPSTFQPHQAAPIVAICPRDRSADSPFAMTSEAPIKKKARVHIPDIHEGDGSGHASFMPPAGPSSLRELMSYPFIFLRIVLRSIHCGLFHHNMMIGQRLKTQYSGIGAWEWSRLLIDKAAAQMMIEHAPCSIQVFLYGGGCMGLLLLRPTTRFTYCQQINVVYKRGQRRFDI